MLARASAKYPDIELHIGNMINLSLNQSFDVLMCLYGSIGLMKTLDNLKQASVTFTTHLKLGGTLCITP
jgi:hypothetical protein